MNKRLLLILCAIVFVIGSATVWFYFWGPCGKKEVSNVVLQLRALADRWADENKLASQSPRIALNQPLSELQKIKRETEALVVPECVQKSKGSLTSAMESIIDGYLIFMGNPDDEASAVLKFQEASESYKQFSADLSALNTCAPYCRGSVASIKKASNRDREELRKTLIEIRTIAIGLETYGVDNSQYPPAKDVFDLKQYLEPKYVKTLPQRDKWGNPYLYVVTEDHAHYSVISSGADGEFHRDVWRSVGSFDDLTEDIVFSDGEFKRYPRGIQP